MPALQQAALHTQAAQHLHHVGAKDDAGANPGKGRRLLVDGDRKAFSLQEGRTRQPAKARTDDGDPVLRSNRSPKDLGRDQPASPMI